MQGWSVIAARLAKWDEGHVCQQEAGCLYVVCNAKVAPLCVCIGTSLPCTRPQGSCQLLPAKHDGSEHRHVNLVLMPHMEEPRARQGQHSMGQPFCAQPCRELSAGLRKSYKISLSSCHNALPGFLILPLMVKAEPSSRLANQALSKS